MGEQTSLAKINTETSKYLLAADQLSAVPSAFNTAQLKLLHSPTPEEHVHEFPKNAGKMAGLKFVTGGYMKHMLDRLTGCMWSFEVKEKGNSAGQIWVLGRLTLYKEDGSTLLFKEQFGRANIKMLKDSDKTLDLGNDMKAAATDAFKKCASEVGVARDIYAPHEFLEADIVDRKDVEELNAADNETDAVDNPNTDTTVPKHEKVDADFKKMVTNMINERFTKAQDRIRYIKDVTHKINLQACNEWDWRAMYDDLKARQLADIEARDNGLDDADEPAEPTNEEN